MQKTIHACIAFIYGSLGAWSCFGQNFAPGNLTGEVATFTISAGSGGFAGNGQYRLFTSAAGSNYTALEPVGAPLVTGAYSYEKASGSSATLALLDAQGGTFSLQLSFSSATAGSYSLTGGSGGGSQSGMFALSNYFTVTTPDLFMPALNGTGQFEAMLAGQEGLDYAIDTSSDFSAWSPWTNVVLPDLTGLFTDAAAPGIGRFYRARAAGANFAPASISNQTFNVAIVRGAAPLSTNGIFQWSAGAADQSYQVSGGINVADSAGTYSYGALGGNAAEISWTDSSSGSVVTERLVFTSPSSGWFYLTQSGSSGYEEGTLTMAEGTVEYLGDIAFTSDTARAQSLDFVVGLSPATLSVTNGSGWVWTLNLPPDALAFPMTITMTPFASVDSSEAAAPITNGVLLEPDGLEFCDGVTLTATPPGATGTHVSLLMASDSGADLHFVEATNEAGAYATTLFHFTSGGASDPSDSQWQNFTNKYLPKAEAAFAQAKSDLLALEKTNSIAPPPPDYPWTCSGTNIVAGQAISAYVKALFAKQNDATKRLLSAATQLTQFGQAPTNDPHKLIRAMIESNEIPETQSLFDRYYRLPDADNVTNNLSVVGKFMAVYVVATSVNQQDKLYGAKGNTNWNGYLKSWAKAVRGYYLNQLKTQHDYTMVGISEEVDGFIQTTFGGLPDMSFDQQLSAAMTFQLTTEITMNGTASEQAEGAGTLKAFNGFVSVSGTVTNNYDSGSLPGETTLVLPQSYTVSAQTAGLDACDSLTPNILVDRFGPTAEQWTTHGVFFNNAYLQPYSETAFSSYVVTGTNNVGWYSFPVSLKNRSAEAVNQTFEDTAGSSGEDIELHFILTHTPQTPPKL